MDPNVYLPLASSTLSFVFALFLLDQWLERRRPYQLIWTIGMLWYGISAGTEFWGGAFGWSEPVYRAWYLIGGVYVAAWLGLGSMLLLGRTRFGYGAAISFILAGLFTYLSWVRYDYADSAGTQLLYPAVALGAAVAIAVVTFRSIGRWAPLAGAFIVVGSIVAVPIILLAPIAAPGYALDATGIPVGDAVPGFGRLLTPLFNVTGGFALALGALYSTYMFMPKVRVIRYDLRRDRGLERFLLNLAVAPVAITVNLVASLPGTLIALVRGRLHSRVPATILIAIGGFVPSLTSGLSRFGVTETFFLGELLGVVFLFAGFLVSIEVFKEFRIPFTRRVLRIREEAAEAGVSQARSARRPRPRGSRNEQGCRGRAEPWRAGDSERSPRGRMSGSPATRRAGTPPCPACPTRAAPGARVGRAVAPDGDPGAVAPRVA